ncbi:MAG: hypothetical protein HYX50_03680 [Chloroflexi bacterium]|nr:hypothetical protein [Chloroflexota bacterium]
MNDIGDMFRISVTTGTVVLGGAVMLISRSDIRPAGYFATVVALAAALFVLGESFRPMADLAGMMHGVLGAFADGVLLTWFVLVARRSGFLFYPLPDKASGMRNGPTV